MCWLLNNGRVYDLNCGWYVGVRVVVGMVNDGTLPVPVSNANRRRVLHRYRGGSESAAVAVIVDRYTQVNENRRLIPECLNVFDIIAATLYVHRVIHRNYFGLIGNLHHIVFGCSITSTGIVCRSTTGKRYCVQRCVAARATGIT